MAFCLQLRTLCNTLASRSLYQLEVSDMSHCTTQCTDTHIVYTVIWNRVKLIRCAWIHPIVLYHHYSNLRTDQFFELAVQK